MVSNFSCFVIALLTWWVGLLLRWVWVVVLVVYWFVLMFVCVLKIACVFGLAV